MYEPNCLAHYGILGMKWGVRRFQPYSVRGRKSGKGGKEVGEARQKGPSHDDLVKSTNASEVYKYRDRLNDKELRDRVNRIQTEQQLKQLIADSEKKKRNGNKFANDVVKRVGTMAAAGISAWLFKKGKAIATEVMSDPGYYFNTEGFGDAFNFLFVDK